MEDFKEKLFWLLFCWIFLIVSILGLILGGVVFMFKKGYWLIPVLVAIAVYFCYPDQMKFWEEPVVEVQPVVECHYELIRDNGYEFRLEACPVENGVEVTWYLGGEVVLVMLVDAQGSPSPLFVDFSFWKEYIARKESITTNLRKKLYRDDI